MLRFRVLGASFSSPGCFVFEIWVLRASVFVFECFVFETTLIVVSVCCVSVVDKFSVVDKCVFVLTKRH